MADQKIIGICPCCGSNLIATPKAFGCENPDCKARIWVENKYFEAIGFKCTEEHAIALFNEGETWVEGLKSKKTGNSFDAYITAEFDSENWPQYGMRFKERESTPPKVIGVCPSCMSNLIAGNKFYGCENRECKNKIWKENKFFESIGFNITEEQAIELFNGNPVWVEGLTSKKTGKTFDAFIKAEFTGDDYPQFNLEFKNDES